ncbi:biotin--[acetyl-CoA-carboxylase] ligase [Gardnerella sp. Marseille-Q9181]|uniref:biotin--[acetyl-CoA-carboxylase] ligase n=1 Tax=Gardnerella sp. Marseille-Q9181 TaxID=3383029 RepID=UPI003AF79AAF
MSNFFERTKNVADGFVYFEVIDSTQNYARKILADGCAYGCTDDCGNIRFVKRQDELPAIYVVAACHQTEGKGRLCRKWVSKPFESLLASFATILPSSIVKNPSYNGWLPIIAGLATRDSIIGALKEFGSTQIENGELPDYSKISLKWPNDIFIGDCKEGGVLTEIVLTPKTVAGDIADPNIGVIFGIGLNLFMDKQSLPIEEATSLKMHYDNLPDFAELGDNIAARLVENLRIRLGKFVKNTNECSLDLLKEASEACWTLGRKVIVRAPNDDGLGIDAGVDDSNNADAYDVGAKSFTSVEGVAQNLMRDASIQVRKDSGQIITVRTGDVCAVRI